MRNNYSKYTFQSYSKNNFTTSEAFISVLKSGIITFSKGFIHKHNLIPQKHRFVNFLYDTKKKAIGLNVSDKKTDDSFTIAYDNRGRGASISCVTFFKSFKIDSNKYAGRYPYEIILPVFSMHGTSDGKIYIIELKKNDNE